MTNEQYIEKVIKNQYYKNDSNKINFSESNEIFSKLPNVLYKYRSCDAYIDSYLKKGHLHFTPLSQLNDRYEGITNYTKNKILSKNDKELFNEYIEIFLDFVQETSFF